MSAKWVPVLAKMDKSDVRLGRRMLAVYREKDRDLSKVAAESSCTKGCSSCCNRLIRVTFPEAVAIAEYVISRPEFKLDHQRILDGMYAQLAEIKGLAPVNTRQYFEQSNPCVFLTPEKTCSIYEVRPTGCRSHFVSTAPTACAPTSAEPVQALDTEATTYYMNSEALRVSKQTNTPLWSGPLQVMLTWAFLLLREGRQSVEALHAKDLGILDLNRWRLLAPARETVEVTLDPSVLDTTI